MIINLRKYYSYIYPRDMYINVPDEIAVILKQMNRMEHAQNERRRIHRAYYSLDMDDEIERDAVIIMYSPQEIYEKKIRYEKLYSVILSLPEKQMKRIYAHFFLGMSISKIAYIEHIDESSVRGSIKRALNNMKKQFKNF